MNSIYWNWLQKLDCFNESMLNSLASFMQACQQSTLWIGNTSEVGPTEITIRETAKRVSIEVLMADIDINNIEIQVSQETLFLQGKLSEETGVDGYFHPGQFKTLIPLPHPVEPETASAELKQDVLLIRLFKKKAIQPSRIPVYLNNSNFVFPQICERELELESQPLHYLTSN